MSVVLNFKPDYYKITQLINPNVIEVNDTWFIRLKGVGDSTAEGELEKWLKTGNIVRVIPYRRSEDARIISDVWLGNTHINRQFSNYKVDNFIQAFKYFKEISESQNKEKPNGIDIQKIRNTVKAEHELITAYDIAKSFISQKLKKSIDNWIEINYLKEVNGNGTDLSQEQDIQRIEIKNQMIQDFDSWIKERVA